MIMFIVLFSNMLITANMAVWEGRLGSEPVQDLIILVLFFLLCISTDGSEMILLLFLSLWACKSFFVVSKF